MNEMEDFCEHCEKATTSKRVPLDILHDTLQSADSKLGMLEGILSNKHVYEIFRQCRRDLVDLGNKYFLIARVQIEPKCNYHCLECNATSKLCNCHDFEKFKQIELCSVDNISESTNEVRLQTNFLNI